MSRLLTMTNAQKILDFLCQQPGEQFLAVEIQTALKISKGGVSISLRELAKEKLVNRLLKGNAYLYSVAPGEPGIKQFKVLKNVLALEPLVSRLKPLSKKIVLFGSSARGEDSLKSDTDLCVITNNPQQVEGILKKNRSQRKLQVIIRSPVQFVEMEKRDPVFWSEVAKGIVLWEGRE